MANFYLSPLNVCRLCFGSDAAIAEIVGVSRGQTVTRWVGVPRRHMEALVSASLSTGLFPISLDMLIKGAEFEVRSCTAERQVRDSVQAPGARPVAGPAAGSVAA